MSFLKKLAVLAMGVCIGCSAQTQGNSAAPNPELNKRIENQIRAHFGVPPTVKIEVGVPKPSELSGYDTVTVTMSDADKKKDYDFLLSKDGKTLARLTKFDISKDPWVETMSKIDTAGRPVRGNKDAKVTIVNYDDFECPFCAQMHQTMNDVVKKFGDQIKVVYKDYPLTEIHPWANRAAIDSSCLAVQNGEAFWDFADYVHANQASITGKAEHRTLPGMEEAVDKVTLDIGRKHNLNVEALQACVKDQSQGGALKKSLEEASGLDVNATPTMFVNGERLEGVIDENTLVEVIKKHLQDNAGSANAGK